MLTFKIKYSASDTDLSLIASYQRQYSSCLHWMYNRVQEHILSNSEIEHQAKLLANQPLMNSWFRRCALWEAKQLQDKHNIVFGGKKNFRLRCQGKITKKEFQAKRLSPIYSIGEISTHSVKGNRFFHLEQDLEMLIFKPDRKTRIELKLSPQHNRMQTLRKLYELQEAKEIALTYKLDQDFVYLTFDESLMKATETKKISNRIFGIDLNPNYIGWSIVDWKSESGFEVIQSGVYSFKDLNDKEFNLKGQHIPNSDPQRVYINNKRKHEIFEVAKNLIDKALYYKVESVAVEDLSIASKDNHKSKRFNSQVNHQWLRNDFVNNLQKRCNIFGIRLQKVKAEYSSFIGNFVFRNLNLPDPILASIELSRRAYEFISQYIKKFKEPKKNIVWLDKDLFTNLIAKSMEEFGLKGTNLSLYQIYSDLKTRKIKYRVPVTSVEG